MTRLGGALGVRPWRWIGLRSYGSLLWQWPVIVLANPHQVPMTWPRAVLEVAATFAIASLSWRYVEEPIRQGALGRLWRQVRAGARRARRSAQRRRRALAGAAPGAVAVAGPRPPGAPPAAARGPGAPRPGGRV